MNYAEYGTENGETIILLHGGGLSWWSCREAAELLGMEYHVILPVLDGHAGADRDFTSIGDNAGEIIEFIDRRFQGSVLMMGGLSLGGQILLEILSRRPEICRYALIESALVLPSRLTAALIGPAFEMSYGLIRKKWFSALQFRALKMKKELFEEYYRDSCGISKDNLIAFVKASSLYAMNPDLKNCRARVCIAVGARESGAMRKSAALIHREMEDGAIRILPGLYHGEFSISHAQAYARAVEQLIARQEARLD